MRKPNRGVIKKIDEIIKAQQRNANEDTLEFALDTISTTAASWPLEKREEGRAYCGYAQSQAQNSAMSEMGKPRDFGKYEVSDRYRY